MTRSTRPKEEPPAPEPAKPGLGWRVALAVWAFAFALLVLYELAGFAWQALRGTR